MDSSSLRTISRQAVVVITILLVVEFAVFGILISVQPTKGDVISNELQNYKHQDGFGYGTTDLRSSFYGTSIYTMLGKSLDSTFTSNMENFVLSKMNKTTGLYMDSNGYNSLHETYYAIGALNQIGNLSSVLNITRLQDSILSLESSNGFFREYQDTDQLYRVYGTLGNLFEAVSILSKINYNTTAFYLLLNRTQIAQSLAVIQNNDGGINSGNFQNEYNMKNMYYATSIISKLNVSLTFFNDLGLDTNLMVSWIDKQFSENGFRMTGISQPTIEASAYALISLKRLGVSDANISANYKSAIDEVVHELIEEIGKEADPIDAMHDLILALSITGNLDRLQEKQIPDTLEIVMGWLISITSLALLAAFGLTSMRLLKEDESIYFETALSKLLPEIIENKEVGQQKLSELLRLNLEQTVLITHQDGSRGSIRSRSSNFEVLITFTFDTWDPIEFDLMHLGSMMKLLNLDFYDEKLITEVQQLIKEVVETST